MSAKWLEGRVVENRRWTDARFSRTVEGAPLAFEAGQFVRFALDMASARSRFALTWPMAELIVTNAHCTRPPSRSG